MKRAVEMSCLVLSLCMVLFAGGKLYGIYTEYAAGNEVYEELNAQYVVPREAADAFETTMETEMDLERVPVSVDFTALKLENPDVIAWIYCEGTPINYPVVQGEDNDYYLHRLLDGRENKNGTLFMDFRNQSDFSDWNSIIYGHNMKNDAMFGILPEYLEQEFYEMHPTWFLLTEEKNYRIDLAGGYVTSADSEIYAIPGTAGERTAVFEQISGSSFIADVVQDKEDRLITLSTCVYDYEDSRYVLVGVLRELELTAEKTGGKQDGF